ncbi:alpha-2-macroglobulin family protein [Frigidibacter sp. ROC022]|uniref:alpha-2-macroglobulin family protein n=1 Tax=Frigidibacter sp. ROC022 TaxID=2971796 RepID=UPI00215A5CD7|nr:alpha-2-macroglobulin family protein [Frigidibacter sp. ROC022]MCR8724719.1 alpha-2-macroglobulin family protein [Frigidibacter sp. ROC022]
MRLVTLAASLILSLGLANVAQAEEPVPPKRLILDRNTDYPGGDIQSYFDTTYDACAAACLANPKCGALTFNQRSNACFLKSGVKDSAEYNGAMSARVLVTDPAMVLNGATRAAELAFLGDYTIDRARQLAMKISQEFNAGSWDVARLNQAAAEARSQGNIKDAILYVGSALTLSDTSDLWIEYARLRLIKKIGGQNATTYSSSVALDAATGGYLRATTPAARINALMVLAEALEANGRGRDMIPVLRLAESIQPRDDVMAALDSALGKYGFRIVEDRVESDLASPRICATFSEPVLSGGTDYASYVTLDQGEPVVTSEGRDICVEGLEHGKRYKVTFRAGLKAASGEDLVKPAELTFYVRDRSKAVWFPGRGYILPAVGDAALPIVGVNVTEVDLKLSRVSDRNLIRSIQNDYFGQPLGYYASQYFEREVAEEVWTGTGTLNTELNRDVTTRLPLGDVVRSLTPGIYVLQASIPGTDPYDDPAATQWFVISDIALASISGNDGLHVFARSINSAEVMPGVKIQLVNRANAVLGEAVTDADGHVVFDAGLTRGQGGSAPAMLVATLGDDLSFLPLTDPEFDLSDRGVEGNPPAPPIDVFLATDRGVYRAGEVINATVLARDNKVDALSGLPMTAVLYRPDGVEYSRVLGEDEKAGGYVFNLPVAGSAPRGTWRLDVFSDPKAPPLASKRVLVEDFLPERIDFDLDVAEGILPADEPVEIGIDARYLFGAPGADLKIEGEVRLSAVSSLEDYPGYSFGRYDKRVSSGFNSLPYDRRTDKDGKAVLRAELPELKDVTGPMKAQIAVRVSEGSGRPVERRVERAVAPAGPVIGIKNLFDDGEVAENSDAGFELIALDTDLKPMPMKVKWTVSRVRTHYQWYKLYGDWNWEPVTSRTLVASGEVSLDGSPVKISAPVTWGRYEIRVERTDGEYASSSSSFYAGWYVSADASATPDTLELSLDAPQYRPGDTARLRIVPRYAGKALITVLSDHLIHMQVADVVEGENLIPLTVTEEWGAGAYVTASVIRPMNAAAQKMPERSLGLSYAKVDPMEHALSVAVEAAEEVDPRGPLPVAVKVEGLQPGETGYVTLAAVDVGILNLTGYKTPDPSDHYFGQRKLGVGLRDVYGRLIDGTQGGLGAVRSGGDAMAEAAMANPPPVEELVAHFSGPIEVGADGYARHVFDLPSFNGTVKLMAIAWSKTGVGQADDEVLVRDPVVVTASVPRFLAPGDTSRLLLEIVHATGPAGRVGLDVTGTGLTLDQGAIPSGFDIAEKGKVTLSIPLVAGAQGLAGIDVNLTTPGGKRLTKHLNLPVQQNDPEISRTSRFDLAAGQTFTLDDNVFAGLVSGSGTATLAVGPIAYLDAPGMLEALDRYPYGCTEQITSKALPLLYLDELAVAMGLDERDNISERIDQAITAVLANQDSSGAFGLWYADSGDFWLDVYVTDFLSRARAQGYEVPALAFRSAIDNIRNQVNYAADFDSGGEDLAYALLVLAREGAATIGDLRYYADQKGDSFGTALAQAQLGAALALYGDQTRADAMFLRAQKRLAGQTGDETRQLWRADYGTNLRDAAGVLTLAVEAGSNVIDRDLLTARVAAPQAYRRLSTQESVWTLLAAHALLGDARTEGITINGQPVDGPMVRVIEDQVDGGMALAVANGSARDTILTLTTYGVPEVPEPAGGNGYALDRSYFTLDGTPVSPDEVKTGTRLVTVLTVDPFGKGEARLIVDDPLPAGFEIDNPNLLRAGDIGALDWLDLSAEPNKTEFRQDRFISAVDWRSDKPFRLAYIVRAISPGTFHHPAASVQDMYRPQFNAHSDAGTVVITE